MSKRIWRSVDFPQVHNRPPNCATCGFLEDCGGLEGTGFLRGCFSRCGSLCSKKGCDLACPSLPHNFEEMFEEVGGVCVPPQANLNTCSNAELPMYIAQIDHGGGRVQPLHEEIVAVPIYAVFGRIHRKRYGIRYDSADSLRKALRLAPDTEIILTCVAPDQCLEDLWHSHVTQEIFPQLAKLRLRAITVPNFSFMLDVPRTNALYNFGRMFRIAERASEAGLSIVFHLQASNNRDWLRWYHVLQEQFNALCVALEFQTGASRKDVGNRYYSGLCNLQQVLGRPLHPIVLAGAGRMRQLKADFQSFSVIDSTPFMKTVNRQSLFQVAKGKWKWHTVRTQRGASLSERMADNIAIHRSRLIESMNRIQDAPIKQLSFSDASFDAHTAPHNS